jgi:amidophosphoribosyltransferase
MAAHPEYADNVALQKANIPYVGNCFRHVRYGTFGKIVDVHPFFASEQLDAQEL